MRKLLGVLGLLVGLGGLIGIVLEKRAAEQQQERLRALTLRDTRPIAAGDRVRITSRAGTFKKNETGAAEEVVAGAGQIGIVVREERPNIIRVRWLPQRWRAFALRERWLELPEFEATIHVSYLSRD